MINRVNVSLSWPHPLHTGAYQLQITTAMLRGSAVVHNLMFQYHQLLVGINKVTWCSALWSVLHIYQYYFYKLDVKRLCVTVMCILGREKQKSTRSYTISNSINKRLYCELLLPALVEQSNIFPANHLMKYMRAHVPSVVTFKMSTINLLTIPHPAAWHL